MGALRICLLRGLPLRSPTPSLAYFVLSFPSSPCSQLFGLGSPPTVPSPCQGVWDIEVIVFSGKPQHPGPGEAAFPGGHLQMPFSWDAKMPLFLYPPHPLKMSPSCAQLCLPPPLPIQVYLFPLHGMGNFHVLGLTMCCLP